LRLRDDGPDTNESATHRAAKKIALFRTPA
jgi:hypothetical protein